MPKTPKVAPSVRDLYPHLSEEELHEAEENLDRYLELILRIYERIERDPETYERLQAALRGEKKPNIDEE